MITIILDWIYQNSAAIIISSLISLLISMMYYTKGNRDELLMSIIFPMIQILNKDYSKKAYDELSAINSNYAIRYLKKKERDVIMLLIKQYGVISQYSKSKCDTDCILSYFDFKLNEYGINSKIYPIYDEDGEIVAYDYPPDYYYLVEYVSNQVSEMEFVVYPEEVEKKIINAFTKYAQEFYTNENIDWFQDYSIEKVAEKSQISQKWKVEFELMEQRKINFMNLSISKKVLKILKNK